MGHLTWCHLTSYLHLLTLTYVCANNAARDWQNNLQGINEKTRHCFSQWREKDRGRKIKKIHMSLLKHIHTWPFLNWQSLWAKRCKSVGQVDIMRYQADLLFIHWSEGGLRQVRWLCSVRQLYGFCHLINIYISINLLESIKPSALEVFHVYDLSRVKVQS